MIISPTIGQSCYLNATYVIDKYRNMLHMNPTRTDYLAMIKLWRVQYSWNMLQPGSDLARHDEIMAWIWFPYYCLHSGTHQSPVESLIARFMGSTWGPGGADRTQLGPMLAHWISAIWDAFTMFVAWTNCLKTVKLPGILNAMMVVWYYGNGPSIFPMVN